MIGSRAARALGLRLGRLAALLGRREDGIAAVEFAMIVPVMFFLFVGSVEFSQAITVDRRVTQIASSVADLVAREKTLTSSQMSGIMNIVGQLVKPYDQTRLKLTVTNVTASPTSATTTTVLWSCNYNGGVATYTPGQTFTLPTGIVEVGTSVIVAEVKYNYTPLIFNYFITEAFDLEERFYLKPRLSNSIAFTGTTC
jgi:Flp pilus assembly protein TadG